MKKIESQVRLIKVSYGNEKFTLDIFKELEISLKKINSELTSQPSNYTFIFLLHKKLTTRFFELKEERKALRGKLYLQAKETTINGRPPSDDHCNAKVETNTKYRVLTKACIHAKDKADELYSLVKGFEQRKDLLQTISSNRRKEQEI